MDIDKPELEGESFKLTLNRNMLPKESKKEYNLEVIGEPQVKFEKRFALNSCEFYQTYKTFKGARISCGMRHFKEFEIFEVTVPYYEYEVKIIE